LRALTVRSRSALAKDTLTVLIVVSLYFVLALSSFRPGKFGDFDFHQEARQLSAWIRGAGSIAGFEIAKAPGPVLYYTIPYLFLLPSAPDDSFWMAGVIWSAIWVCIAFLAIRRLAERMKCDLVGGLAVGLALVPPFIVYYSFGIWAEPPAFVASVLFAYGWIMWRLGAEKSSFSRHWWLCWGGLAFLCLCRPNAVLVVGIAVACGVAAWLGRERDTGAAFFIFTGIPLLCAIGLGAMLIVRGIGGGGQEGNLAHVVLQGRFQYRSEPWDWRYWQASHRVGSLDYSQYSEVRDRLRGEARRSNRPVSNLTWQWIKKDVADHPWLSIRMSGVKMLAQNIAWANSRADYSLSHRGQSLTSLIFHILINFLSNAALILAAVYLFRERGAWLATWPLWGPWLALFIFHALTYVEPRYLLPGRPGISVLAALTLRRWFPAPLLGLSR
jgi:hypothetical protein